MAIANERRTSSYTFSTEKALVAFFSRTMPRPLIKSTMRRLKSTFVGREGDTPEAAQLQFLKKCEYELIRIAGEGVPE
jgi:hypothetical protein